MKKSFLNIAISLFACIVLFNSCKKDDPLPEENPVVNTTPPIFNWKLNNITSLSSDSTFAYQNITTIFAYKGGNANSLEIELTALNTGTYSISSATGNAFTLVSGNVSHKASSGSVIITTNANNKLSGTVSVAFSTGTITTLTGDFTDVTKR
ncbi:MAG: hypothetical protein IT236_16815 [Bacteroidia bacterium]|nr:hypothetical protein [Bacteroidia bacterium]